MIVCDRCKDVKKSASTVFFVTIKEEVNKAGKTKDREMLRIPTHLCEACINTYHAALSGIIKDMATEK